ncbi:MAG: helix-hairpin-helix domain-containing protein [Pseudomonadota bacterium]
MRWALASAAMFALSAHALDLNNAAQADIEKVKGIGPSLSQRIVDERARRPFAGWADLQHRVPGVGPAAAGRWSAQGVTVADRAYAPALIASAASGLATSPR